MVHSYRHTSISINSAKDYCDFAWLVGDNKPFATGGIGYGN